MMKIKILFNMNETKVETKNDRLFSITNLEVTFFEFCDKCC